MADSVLKIAHLSLLIISVASMSARAATDYIQGHIGSVSNQAHSNVGNVPGNRFNANMFFDYHQNGDPDLVQKLESKFSFAGLVNDQSLGMYSLQEAYIGVNLTRNDSFKLGRQILDWSAVDSIWGFGKLNNRRNFDYFEPGQEGLVGLQYEHRFSGGLRIGGFISWLYVPETNPALDINKGDKTITSRHPWAKPPASTADGEGANLKISYDVNQPDIVDVIGRYSVGGNLGFETKHWVIDNFIIRKPENQISLGVTFEADFVERIVDVQIDPEFYHHDVYGSTLKYRNRDVELYVSGIAVRPTTFPSGNEEATRLTEIKEQKRREDYLGGGISKSNDLYSVGLNYVARLSPYDRVRDGLAEDPRWNQALNAFFARSFGRKIKLSVDGKYDMLTTDRLVMFRADYKVSRNLVVNTGINMIGTPTSQESFWSPYTNNDAIYGGLKYVF